MTAATETDSERESKGMSTPSGQPSSVELNKMSTHELVYEVVMAQANDELGESDFHSAAANQRIAEAKAELARRFRKGWAVTGKQAGGD